MGCVRIESEITKEGSTWFSNLTLPLTDCLSVDECAARFQMKIEGLEEIARGVDSVENIRAVIIEEFESLSNYHERMCVLAKSPHKKDVESSKRMGAYFNRLKKRYPEYNFPE